MRKLIIIMSIFNTVFTFAGVNLDSLETILPNVEGKQKIKILSDLCWEYGASNPEKAEKYGLQAVSLSKEIENDTGTKL